MQNVYEVWRLSHYKHQLRLEGYLANMMLCFVIIPPVEIKYALYNHAIIYAIIYNALLSCFVMYI